MFAPSFSRTGMWRVRALLVWGRKKALYVTVSKIISAPSGDP
jgi:hypothetical protein